MRLNSNQIQEIIPHRYPFLLVDQVIDMEAGKYAVGKKAITANEMHFIGHFPNHHVMPGVLITEALAQVGAISLLSIEKNKGKIVYFAGIKNMKFRKPVIPGDVVILKVEVIKLKETFGIGRCVAEVDDEIVAQGELSFAIK